MINLLKTQLCKKKGMFSYLWTDYLCNYFPEQVFSTDTQISLLFFKITQ